MGGMHGHGGGHVRQGVCIARVCAFGDMCGVGCMAEGMWQWACVQERRQLKRAIRILLECILVLKLNQQFSRYNAIESAPDDPVLGADYKLQSVFEGYFFFACM